MIIDRAGYLCRRVTGGGYRNWWLIRHHSNITHHSGVINLDKGQHIIFPSHMIGKKVMFKMEMKR